MKEMLSFAKWLIFLFLIFSPVSVQAGENWKAVLPTLADGSLFAYRLPPDFYILKAGESSRLLVVLPGELTIAE